MNCKEAEKLILPYIRGEIPEQLTEPFIAHVRQCKECYDEFEIYYTIRNLLESDKATTALEEANDVQQLIEDDFEKKLSDLRKARTRKKISYAGVVVAILILIALLIITFNPDETVRIFYDILRFLTE